MKKNILSKLLFTMSLALIPAFSVYAEQDASANFNVDVTDSSEAAVLSYVTTINSDVSIDMGKNYNGYAWIKVENDSSVPVNVYLDGFEQVGDSNVRIGANSSDYKEKYVTLSVNGMTYDSTTSKQYISLKESGYSKSVYFNTLGKTFTSKFDNIGLIELQVKLSNNYVISDDDVLSYGVTMIVEENTYNYDYEKNIYTSYDEETGITQILVSRITNTALETQAINDGYTTWKRLRTYLYSSQYDSSLDSVSLLAETSYSINDTQTVHYYLYEDGNEYANYGVMRTLFYGSTSYSKTSTTGVTPDFINVDDGNYYTFNSSMYHYLSDNLSLTSNYYKS